MFKRKLKALDFYDCDNFNLADQNQFRCAIAWLEDQKIRHYRIEDRSALRQTTSSEWVKAFEQYLSDLHSPFGVSDKQEFLFDWLLNFALRLEYQDNYDKLKDLTSDKLKEQMNKPRVVNNPLDNLDFQTEDFKEGVNHLAQLLKVPQHPDHLVTLKAISILIRNHLSAEAGQRQTQARKVSSGLSIDSSSSGFQTGDKVLDRAVKVLRLLFISDLRDLQTDINEIIVAVQALTANPKTDTALGKVGK